MLNGESAALVTDAGTPAISDPGADLVRLAVDNNIKIIPIPGACAAINAFLASEFLRREDTLLLESDLVFDDSVLDALIDDPRETLALVDKYESWMDGTCVKIGDDDSIEAFIPGKKFRFDEIKDYYKTVNIYKFSKHFSATRYVPFLEAYSSALGNNEYYEQVLRVIMMLDEPEIKAKRLNDDGGNHLWYEIDDVQDLDIASSMFAPDPDEKVSMIQKRYGGYWRYPQLLDFCYLVNPYFPPRRLLDELKANADELITQYPSGMAVNSLLAAKNFGVPQSNIMVGNGAAELIKLLMSTLKGKFGFIRPTFEEYPHRWSNDAAIDFVPSNDDLAYSADDVISFFDDKPINNLLIVNPDNPSGNYIPRGELIDSTDQLDEGEGRYVDHRRKFCRLRRRERDADRSKNSRRQRSSVCDEEYIKVIRSGGVALGSAGIGQHKGDR